MFVAVAILAGSDALIRVGTLGVVARIAVYDALVATVVFPLVDRFVRSRVAPPTLWRG
jgi:hypothetical protein